MLTQNEYKKNQKCPHCEADNGEVYARAPLVHHEQGNVTQKMYCDLCMKSWTDIYKIARYEKSP